MRNLFISYSTKDKECANALVEALEKKGEYKCFIAPRDIHEGEYAQQIVDAIEKAEKVVLVFSAASNVSAYVLREMNSAVLRSVPIIPYRIEAVELSKGMEFYLGAVQWLDAYKMSFEDTQTTLDSWLCGGPRLGERREIAGKKTIRYSDYAVLGDAELRGIGFDVSRLVMETIEIDYKTLEEGEGDYEINEEIEGSYQDWAHHVKMYPDLFSVLVKDDLAVGYYQYELLNKENYAKVISAEAMISPDMMEFYAFGGEFNLYVAMLSILKEHESMRTMMMLWDRLFKNVEQLVMMGVNVLKIAISVYTSFLRTVVLSMGFQLVNINQAMGGIYELDLSDAKNNRAIKNRYPNLYKLLSCTER